MKETLNNHNINELKNKLVELTLEYNGFTSFDNKQAREFKELIDITTKTLELILR